MSTLVALEQRKHDLRVEMVKLRAENNPAQMVKVYGKLLEVKRAQEYLRRA
jgi:hypothetical protein